MNKFLFRQILNQWRTNIWLIVELVIVSTVLWYITDSLFVTYKTVNAPLNQDTEHCYLIDITAIDSTSAFYKPGDENDFIANLSGVLNHIKHRPEVEAACLVYAGMWPYSPYNSYSPSAYQNENDSIVWTESVYRQLTTSQYPLVFKIYGANGETPEDIAAILKENKLVMSTNGFGNGFEKPENFIGKTIYHGQQITLGAIVPPMRINSYLDPTEYSITNVSVIPNWGMNIAFRVRADQDKDIIPSLLADVNKYVSGNLIISSVKSFKDIKRSAELNYTNETRNFIVVAIFLLVNIFLGLLGTFWFRIQQRISEIALRRAVGANTGQILIRVISEGLVLLTIATIPAIVLDLLIANNQYIKPFGDYISINRTGICILITYAIMALITTLGALAPAMKAIHIDPAIALKDE
ncbi:MAG: FtsX-like permease family protein [Muribaculum sp.]|nr:FtsX-like permease family protein [Muribaculaceae bacterium]MCM1080674.1 FtsX-like permease family protein [Muribaculum sp.]